MLSRKKEAFSLAKRGAAWCTENAWAWGRGVFAEIDALREDSHRMARQGMTGKASVLALGMLLSVLVGGQVPEPRLPAAEGEVEDERAVWETQIAAGANRLVAVYHIGANADALGGKRIGYSVARKNETGAWEWQQEGMVPWGELEPNTPLGDPLVAYDPVNDGYLAVALAELGSVRALVAAKWAGSRVPFKDGWKIIYNVGGNLADRPVIATGQMSAQVQEFYITFIGLNVGCYLRSTDVATPGFMV